DIPKRLLPGAIALGAFTLTMDALPGSPQIQNLIPTQYFGTVAFAAPWARTLRGAAVLAGGLLWLERRREIAASAGEGYGTGQLNEPESETAACRPHAAAAALPLGVVLGANSVLSRTSWSVASWYPAELLKGDFPSVSAAARAPAWALIVALLGITTVLAIGAGRWRGRPQSAVSAAITGAMLAIFNTASEVGFGNTVKGLPDFGAIRQRVFFVSRHVLVSEATTVNVVDGITGSASVSR